jgi:dipeptidyl aminopeptidase/acylaminoacyl peptidase
MAPKKARRRGVAADDVYRLRFVAHPQVSPDGSAVAYVVAWVDPTDHTRYRSQLMLADIDASSPPRALTPEVVIGGDREIASFSVSRDGQHLACAISDPTHPYEVVALRNGQERRLSMRTTRCSTRSKWPASNGSRSAVATGRPSTAG